MAPRRKIPSADSVAEAVRWLGYALGDLATARANRNDSSVPYRNVGYSAQQAGEKAIKAVILLEARAFEMIHEIETLALKVPSDFTVPATMEDLAWLSDLETAARYPDEGDHITAEDIDRATWLADTLVKSAIAHFVARGVDPTTIVAA